MFSYIFSGQGSQYPEMGKELFENFVEVKRVYEHASDIFGFDVAKASFTYSPQEMAQTNISQPLIYTHSLGCLEVAKSELAIPTAVAGHSLGEYAALTCTKVISVEDGFRLIKSRAKAMDSANDGCMFAVLKLDADTVSDVCNQIDGYVVPVNFNSPVQTVIAGEVSAVTQAVEKVTALKGKAIKLAVSSAFHCDLMKDASCKFYEDIKNITWNKPQFDFYSNLTGSQIKEFENLPQYFASHMVSPVKFTNQLNEMNNSGITTYIELGPSKIISGLVKKTLKSVQVSNIEDLSSLNSVKCLKL